VIDIRVMNETNVIRVEWNGAWSYRPADEVNEINNAFWFQLLFFSGPLCLWVVVCIRSATGRERREERITSYLMDTGCHAAAYQAKYFRKSSMWLFRPNIILTRTTASLVIAIASIELFLFNAIANYLGEGSVNAFASLVIILQGVLFHFYTTAHKYRKNSDSDGTARGTGFMLLNSLVFCMAVGIFLCILAYLDAFSWKDKDKKSVLFLVGVILCNISLLGTFTVPLVAPPYTKTKNSKNSKTTLSLVLSGEYYTSLSVLDCIIVWISLAIFSSLEAYFISFVQTKHYAFPFVFLQIIPIYGFITNLLSCATRPDRFETSTSLPHVYNMAIFSVFSVCITNFMLHVCAIPGVSTTCATRILHTAINTNVFVCGPVVLLIAMISLGLVNSTFAPNFIVDRSCIDDVKNRD
jgi:hypothetical protein